MGSTEAETGGSAEDHAYFRALEEAFLRLRGAGTLLSAADWQVAREWRHAGIPLELVVRVMTDLFARQRERAPKRGISSLRYFRAATAAAWDEQLARQAGGYRAVEIQEPSTRDRLEALAAALPETLAGVAAWRTAILALEGSVERIETELAGLDARILSGVELGLDPASRELLEKEAERALRPLAGRLDGTGMIRARTSLWRQLVRRQAALPVLSLFVSALSGDDELP